MRYIWKNDACIFISLQSIKILWNFIMFELEHIEKYFF